MAEKQTAMTEAFYYILLSLKEPNHGYGIIQNTMELTGGRLELGAGTLYGAINTLLDKDWIRLYSEDKQSRKKKQYIITEHGSLALRQEIERLEELVENGKRILQQESAVELQQKECAGQKMPGESKGKGYVKQGIAAESGERRERADDKVQVVF